MRKLLALALGISMMVSLVACNSSSTDDYPTKAITNIVSVSAGGSTDLYTRLVGSYMEEYLGQTMVVENVTGGAQVIGTTQIGESDADGYTIGAGWSASFGMRPYLLDVTYDVDDFTYICGIMDQIESVIVRADSPYETLEDLMNALAEDSSIPYSAGSAGSFQYLWSRYVMDQVGVEGLFIPHDGDADALTSLLNGTVEFTFAETTSALSGIRSGDYRVLATCMTERDPAQPDVPSLVELGYECELAHTLSFVCPADVPDEIVEKIYNAVEQIMQDPDFIAQAEQAGYSVCFKTGDEIRAEIDALTEIVVPMIDAGLMG